MAALLAVGQTYVIILAEIDLSVGAALGFSAVVTRKSLAPTGSSRPSPPVSRSASPSV